MKRSLILSTIVIAYCSINISQAQETRVIHAAPGTPTIDGEIDEMWSAAPTAVTDRICSTEASISADDSASAKFRCMWDETHLYILAEVTDSQLGTDGIEAWQQDSVEFFVDENMERSTSYQDDDGQYRVNCKGEMTFGESTSETMKAAARKSENGYIVEAAIDLRSITAADAKQIGFDVQVNDDASDGGEREGLMKWNDDSNDTWQDLSKIGTLIFCDAENLPKVEPENGDKKATTAKDGN